MPKRSESVEMTELERIEVTRRKDIALAVIPIAVEAFAERADFDEAIKKTSKKTSSYWVSVFFFGGLVLNHFVSSEGNKYTWAIYISLIAALYWLGGNYDVSRFRVKRERCNDRLRDLQLRWSEATGSRDFYSIVELKNESALDWHDSGFRDWWARHRDAIIFQVCGYEKGKRLTEDLAREEEGLREFQRRLHESPDA